jgi:hypothetical protein
MTRRNWMLIAGVAAAVAAAPDHALAVTGCGANLMTGTYAMQFSGAASSTRLSGLARLTFDADGYVQGYSNVNVAGAWQKRDVSGTYTVNDDCTVSFTIIDTSGTTRSFSGVIANQGASLLVLQTDPGVQVSASLSRVRNFCQVSDLTGSFGLQYQSLPSEATQAVLTSVGLVTIDADGNVIAAETRVSAGSSSLVASAGTLTVDSDCSATLTLTPLTGGDAPVAFQGMFGQDSRSLMLVGVAAGRPVTGAITAQ